MFLLFILIAKINILNRVLNSWENPQLLVFNGKDIYLGENNNLKNSLWRSRPIHYVFVITWIYTCHQLNNAPHTFGVCCKDGLCLSMIWAVSKDFWLWDPKGK